MLGWDMPPQPPGVYGESPRKGFWHCIVVGAAEGMFDSLTGEEQFLESSTD